ncbi:J domain-containing protein [Hymenobacter baengnokdamensis]|uniref:J domain-containing protein n=1 Tax=Hymenobacter baengnokdamensis TaxID=2615203 RepID=UPI0012483C3C|nr:J domain-containing protein [Hymenobacter baengnokdamensis]
MSDFSALRRQFLPDQAAPQGTASVAQQAFRQAIEAVNALREQLRVLLASQAAARQTYWRQVGPVAVAAVAARRSLYAPLEVALTSGYLTRAEEVQVTELLVHNALSLQERFGEDETEVLARYAPAAVPLSEPPLPAASAAPPELPHEQAAALARARRQQRARAKAEEQLKTRANESHDLLQHTKAAYRQLARLHHPDRAARADATTQQTQTELMQRITAAYAAADLAALLTLLAESEAVGEPGTEAAVLLERYTAALKQQYTQLTQELATAQRPVENAPWSGTEKQQRTRLRQLKRDLRAETDYLALLVRQLHEPAALRQLLRELSARRQNIV